MQINDIAKLSGVGVGTVSRVINNHSQVSDKTREKVQKVIDDNNYVPNNSARILKMNNTKNIGVLVRGVFNPFFSEIIDTMRKDIEKAGYFMVLHQSDLGDSKEELNDIIAFIKESKLQGLIYLGAQIEGLDNETFKRLKIPLIFTSANTVYDENIDTFSTITIENDKSAYTGVNYLIKKGHKEIAIILGDENDRGISKKRFEGYLKALGDNNIMFKEYNVIYGEYGYEGSYIKTKELLNNNPKVTAIFAISDIMAVGAAKAITDKGLVPGKDISLMGFDGMDITKYYTPSITTIEQPKKEIAVFTTKVLFDMLKGECGNKHLILETKLIERDSCNDIN
ncbi:LacI family DNA-binding transcriptional regulator [Clostridium gasigenes]|uniref:LacI family DNA-binding transcriptional regulator n=1 Tax=Clostridium gasigenes TaxID=94869 RepID=UPI001C0B82CC|nr:LacI family DNA-binding transcriptional regulator [Clostridium gasigenes]MBU3108787.1 LacI family transcriptional regulator [Clostridium gasigenes]